MVSLRFATLGLLAQHPGSGYDLLKRFEKSMANVWPATQSQLYGELNRLADAGLIEVTDVGPRGRKEYRVTPEGRAELRRWITDSTDDPPLRRPDLLRVFLLGELSPAAARKYATGFAEHARTELARLEALRDSLRWDDDAAAFYGRAALEYGLRLAAMEAEWADGLTAAIDSQRD
ncbi:PadR family transcriptional regulator [Mycobacterium sp. GA-2829]|uniref:PadR family transcriptional regulator n=1 Tax=Mycobacterium sp. GA-2829 TaxID=1772283 RepID=UPI00074039AA|nr:PadR family transcriptional regulator [Mycobacterium sp. GA-2829]KUI36828.1 PadR family transcriptional regulator [Mycobacterium sp. GA-2829]